MKRITGKIVSIVLTLCMVLGLVPEQVSAANTSQTKYADINDFQEARWKQIQSEVFESTSGYTGGGIQQRKQPMRWMPVRSRLRMETATSIG